MSAIFRPFPSRALEAALTADPPSWPAPTRGLSSLRLELRIANTGFIARQIGDYRSQQIEIIDYPGEWLLDLPMMEQSFEQWSEAMIAASASAGQAWHGEGLACGHRAALTTGGAERDRAATLAGLYRRYLEEAQAAGFSLLQPGRMTMPGDMAGAEHLNFCPMRDKSTGGR